MKKMLKQSKLQDLFEESVILTEKALMNMSKAVKQCCIGKNAQDLIDETIETEKKQDRVREQILERLFGRETMVFSRSDRLHIIYSLDHIVDKAESIVRKLTMHTPKTNEEIQNGIIWLGEQTAHVGSLLRELIISIFSDFSKGAPLMKKISDIRREARTKEYELLTFLFKSDLPTGDSSEILFFSGSDSIVETILNLLDFFVSRSWTTTVLPRSTIVPFFSFSTIL